MKPEIHPAYNEITVTCSCGNKFITRSTLEKDLHLDICAKCHPFFTGQQKRIDSTGRIERFKNKFAKTARKSVAPAAANDNKDKE